LEEEEEEKKKKIYVSMICTTHYWIYTNAPQ